MISSWKCIFIIILKILLVTTDQNHEVSTRSSYLINAKDINARNDLPSKNHPTNFTIYTNYTIKELHHVLKPGTEEKTLPDGKNSSRVENTGVTTVDDVPPTSAKTGFTRLFNSDRKNETTMDFRSTDTDTTAMDDLPPTSDTNYTIYLKTGREGKTSPDWKNFGWDENTGVTALDNVPPTSVKTSYTRRFYPDREVETTTDKRRNTHVDICSQPQEPGHCFRNYVLLRWYYDSSNNTCKMFQYSGCGGNDNCFDDFHGCSRVCIKKSAKGICNQPRDAGYCFGRSYYYRLKWYYDNSTNSCEMFYYSGCRGNDNRFTRLQACQQQCVRDETTTDLHPTDGQMGTSDYIYPDIRTEDWKFTTGVVDWTDWEEENTVVIDVPTSYERSVWTSNNIFGYTLVIAFVLAVLTFIRMTIAKCRSAEQDEQLLGSNDETRRTSSSDDNSSPLRFSVCVISLRNSEQQSSDESTAGCEMPKFDQNSSEAPPAYYPPPYEP